MVRPASGPRNKDWKVEFAPILALIASSASRATDDADDEEVSDIAEDDDGDDGGTLSSLDFLTPFTRSATLTTDDECGAVIAVVTLDVEVVGVLVTDLRLPFCTSFSSS